MKNKKQVYPKAEKLAGETALEILRLLRNGLLRDNDETLNFINLDVFNRAVDIYGE